MAKSHEKKMEKVVNKLCKVGTNGSKVAKSGVMEKHQEVVQKVPKGAKGFKSAENWQ